jgi:hypothetical protein
VAPWPLANNTAAAASEWVRAWWERAHRAYPATTQRLAIRLSECSSLATGATASPVVGFVDSVICCSSPTVISSCRHCALLLSRTLLLGVADTQKSQPDQRAIDGEPTTL